VKRRPAWLRTLTVAAFTLLAAALALLYPALTRGQELLHADYQQRWFLLALLLVPAVFVRGIWGEDRRIVRLKLGTLLPLAVGPTGPRVFLRDLPGVLRALAVAFFALALARPVNTLRPQASEDEGIDVIVVLDMSGSMQAAMTNIPEDLKRYLTPKPRGERPTRLDVAKATIRDFIGRRKSDRIGVVIFGASAYVLSPPTLDYQLLDHMVSRMEIKMIDQSGTAIGDAVGVAAARLRRSPVKSKAIVLLTDGDNKGGKISPEDSAELANTVGAKLFTVQIGQGELAEVFQGFSFGQPIYSREHFPVNPELLKKLAQKTGGAAYVATDAKALQASFHDVLDRLEKTKLEGSIAHYEELFGFFLLPGVVLLAADALLRALLLRRFP
jgi:Ca-activated chloride channel family protein